MLKVVDDVVNVFRADGDADEILKAGLFLVLIVKVHRIIPQSRRLRPSLHDSTARVS